MQHESRRNGFGSAIFATLLIALVTYLTFAALQGEYGLLRLIQIEIQEARMRAELAELRTERAVIFNKTSRLSEVDLDLDLLDEQARKVLGLARGDEIIIR